MFNWFSCTKKLPSGDYPVLITVDNEGLYYLDVGIFDSGKWYVHDDFGMLLPVVYDVIGWIPIPFDPYVEVIGVADVEASSQDPAAALPKRTASNLDQRGAGDEVSLDQHIQLYKEVF